MSLRTYYLRKKFWINDFLHGSRMWKHYKDITRLQGVEGGLERKQYIDRILAYAKSNTAFYSKISGEALSDFPVINKQTILDNYTDFIVQAQKIPGQQGPVHIQKTSGSTGTPFSVYQDTECRIRRIATIKYENDRLGFHSFEPMMHLRAVKHYWGGQKCITYNRDLNIIYVDNADLTEEHIHDVISSINKFKVKVVRGYMTTLDTITRYAEENNLELYHHPLFISVGELLLESLRKRVVDILGCKIVSQYANEENGVFGTSEINGPGSTIYLNMANCHIEILKMDSDVPAGEGELGRIVVTDFTNHAMPMIRYDIGDTGMAGTVTNGELTSIKNLSGRKTDLIYTTQGKCIDLFNSLSPDIYNNPSVRQWQFVQESEKTYTLKLNVRDDFNMSEDQLRSEISRMVGDDGNINIDYVDDIPVLSSGKRKIVVQKYKKNE